MFKTLRFSSRALARASSVCVKQTTVTRPLITSSFVKRVPTISTFQSARYFSNSSVVKSEPPSSSSKSTPPPPPPPPRKDDAPKFRYIVLVSILGTILFVYAERSVRKKKPRDFTSDDYEAIKARAKLRHKKSAFTPDEALVIFVLGGPGSGKGTQCANLVKNFDFVHLSAGDLLREEQAREGSEYGELISNYIKEGKIVPQEVTLGLLKNAMKAEIMKRLDQDPHYLTKNGPVRFLIDGFPRKMDQALSFEDNVCVSRFTLYFECPEEVMLKRLLKRGETSGRSDDNVESIKKRFRTFIETSMPVINYFDTSGKVLKISCDQPVDDVYNQVKIILQEKLGLY